MRAPRWLLHRAVPFLLVVGVPLLLLLSGLVYIYTADGPPVDDAHMRVPPATLEGTNGAEALRELVEWAKRNEELIDETLEQSNDYRALLEKGGEHGDELPSKILATYDANARFVSLLQEVGKHDYIFLDIPQSPTASMEHLGPIMHSAQFMVATSMALAAAGRHEEAYRRVLETARLGGGMRRSGEALLHVLVGMSVDGMALDQIHSLVPYTDDRLLLQRTLNLLDTDSSDAAAWEDALRSEYRFSANFVDKLAANDAETWQAMADYGFHPYPPIPSWMLLVGGRYMLKPEITKRISMAVMADLIDSVPSPEDQAYLDEVDQWRRSDWRIFHPNVIPYALISMSRPSLQNAKRTFDRATTRRRLTRCLVALRLFELGNRRLPENLGELVPEIIEAVPIDPFDGMPIRYDVSRKLLWSVGENGLDQSGIKQDDPRDEIVVPINF